MDLGQIEKEAENSISLVKNTSDLEKWRIKYLGRKSALSLFFNSLSKLPLAEKKKQGQKANTIRQLLSSLYKEKKVDIESNTSFNSFQKMGFSIIEGSEMETEYYNFDALNIPAGHPAREMWDTLWIKPEHKNQKSKMLLRTHTSPMQVRFMETHQPPFRIIVPGKCFRYEATDASHEIQFHQIEGLMVGENISLSNFKAIIEEVVEDIFKQKVLVRFRPSYFPFVSPGVEVDIKMKSKAKGQKSKVKDEWLEIMGAGMVHPDLFKRAGYVTNRWQGFAFGLGVERIAMIKYHIDDIRLFFSPDVRFLEQF